MTEEEANQKLAMLKNRESREEYVVNNPRYRQKEKAKGVVRENKVSGNKKEAQMMLMLMCTSIFWVF